MASGQELQRDWVSRVLKVEFSTDRMSGMSSGTAAFAKMQLDWRDAQSRVRAELEHLAGVLLAHPGVQADSRLPQVKAAAAELPSLVPPFGERFEGVINDVIKAGSLSGALAEQGEAALADYRGALARTPALAQLEVFARKHLKLDLKLFSDLGETLKALSAEFKQSAATAAARS